MVLLIESVNQNIYMELDSKDIKFLKALGAQLRSIRKSKGWTLEEAEQHGWTNWRHLQQVESGKNITIITLRKIAKLYKVKLSEILEDL